MEVVTGLTTSEQQDDPLWDPSKGAPMDPCYSI